MFKYVHNPEIKKSTYLLISMMIFFLILLYVGLTLVFTQVKHEYVSTQAAIVGIFIEKHPELKEDFVPIITKGFTKNQEKKGQALLKEYGYTDHLEMIFLPQLKTWKDRIQLTIFSLVVLFFMSFLFFNSFQYRMLYKNIHHLTLLINDVLEHKYDAHLPYSKEGDFSRLLDRFNQMRLALKNNMILLKKEKQFSVELLSDITHQLKTPLASLILFNEIMMDRKLSEEQRQTFLYNSQQQLERIEWLVNAFLKLTKLDAGTILLQKEKQSLNQTVLQSMELLKGKAKEKGIHLELKTNEDVVVYHDRKWLMEAITNIVENGIEHTHSGGYIKIMIEETPFHFKVKITDNGEGMHQRVVSKIFRRFYQGNTKEGKNTVGVGLSLSKKIVEAHTGYIEVESEEGKGSVFTLILLKVS